jgi:hypothetical protein
MVWTFSAVNRQNFLRLNSAFCCCARRPPPGLPPRPGGLPLVDFRAVAILNSKV